MSSAAAAANSDPTRYISENHLEDLRAKATAMGLDAYRVLRETADANLMEGIYIKVEENGEVV